MGIFIDSSKITLQLIYKNARNQPLLLVKSHLFHNIKLKSTRLVPKQNSTHSCSLLLNTSNKFSTNLARLTNTNSQPKHSTDSLPNSVKLVSFQKLIKYGLFALVGAIGGVFTGYWLMLDQSKLGSNNETHRYLTNRFEATKLVDHSNSSKSDFPLSIHVYQYESCPYCSQIRAYLDYFGFSYKLTEVDSYSKNEITKFKGARSLPIVVIKDKITKKKWHLTNSTVVLSALESLRNDKKDNRVNILNLYLSTFKGKSNGTTSTHVTSNKYSVSGSDLANGTEWRKWINNVAIPVFKLNSMSTWTDLLETFDYYSEKSGWPVRYGLIKYYYVYYANAFKTYSKYNSLVEQLNAKQKPRDLLHDTISTWENGLGENTFISGTDIPNLADISMYGNVRAYEGCALFRESIAKHPKFRSWYETMKKETIKGYSRHAKKSHFFLQSVDEENEYVKSKPFEQPASAANRNNNNNNNNTFATITTTQSTQTQTQKETLLSKNHTIRKNIGDLPQLTIFRVLTLNYIINLIAFTYAGYMGK